MVLDSVEFVLKRVKTSLAAKPSQFPSSPIRLGVANKVEDGPWGSGISVVRRVMTNQVNVGTP